MGYYLARHYNMWSFFNPPHTVLYSGVALTICSVFIGIIQYVRVGSINGEKEKQHEKQPEVHEPSERTTIKKPLTKTCYRQLEGGLGGELAYDKLVSIEMVEAVGADHLDEYFGHCSRLVKPGGAMLLQAITIQDQFYRRALKSVDFIQRYVFPGSFIPSIEALAGAVARATDFKIFHLEDIGPHYARTLRLLAGWISTQPREDPRAGLRRKLRAPVGVLPVLLRGRLHRAPAGHRADIADQAALPACAAGGLRGVKTRRAAGTRHCQR